MIEVEEIKNLKRGDKIWHGILVFRSFLNGGINDKQEIGLYKVTNNKVTSCGNIISLVGKNSRDTRRIIIHKDKLFLDKWSVIERTEETAISSWNDNLKRYKEEVIKERDRINEILNNTLEEIKKQLI